MKVARMVKTSDFWQIYRRDRRGWFKSGWGWNLEKVVNALKTQGYRVEVCS